MHVCTVCKNVQKQVPGKKQKKKKWGNENEKGSRKQNKDLKLNPLAAKMILAVLYIAGIFSK